MSVKIRLTKRGRKKLAIFDIVVTNSKTARDGKYIEKLGQYNPNTHPATIVLNNDKAFEWIMTGAQPTDTARTILSEAGVMLRKHLQIGVNKGAITQEAADKKLADWKSQKESAKSTAKGNLEQTKAAARKARLEAETKVAATRAESIKLKALAAEEAAVAAAAPAPEAASEEAPAAETAAE